MLNVLNLTHLPFWGLAGRFRSFLAFGSLVLTKLIGISLFLVCKAGLTPEGVNLTLYVLGYLPKRGPNQYFITGNVMEVAILARMTLLMWCAKGVKFNTFVIFVFHWPV